MEQRDLLIDQIEKIGRALSKIMENFNRDLDGLSNEVVEKNITSLKDIGLDGSKLINFSKYDLKKHIINLKLSPVHLEYISEIFVEIAIYKVDADPEVSMLYFNTALQLLDMTDEISRTVSFKRMDLKSKIRRCTGQG